MSGKKGVANIRFNQNKLLLHKKKSIYVIVYKDSFDYAW